jgi:hypothetical protein
MRAIFGAANKVISATVFLAAMMVWTPTYATCPGTRLVGGEADFFAPLPLVALVNIPGGESKGTFYEVFTNNGVRTGPVTVTCTGDRLTVVQQPGGMLFNGRPDGNGCTYDLKLTGDPNVAGFYVHGAYTCNNGSHFFSGRLDQ